MKKAYGKVIWASLREHGIWHPGSHAELGDYGLIRESCFTRLGNIRDYAPDFSFQTKTVHLKNVSVKSDCISQQLPQPDNKVSLTVSFNENYGVLMSAAGVDVDIISDLSRVETLLAGIEEWDRSWYVVTSLRRAQYFVLAISSGDAVVGGTQADVDKFFKGDTVDDNALDFGGDMAMKIVGEKGPISARLHRLRSTGNSFKHLKDATDTRNEWLLAPFVDGVDDLREL
jgi:hypothetical protein